MQILLPITQCHADCCTFTVLLLSITHMQVNYALTKQQLSTLLQLYVPNAGECGCADRHGSVVITMYAKLALAAHGSIEDVLRRVKVNKAKARKKYRASGKARKPYILQKGAEHDVVGYHQALRGKAKQQGRIIALKSADVFAFNDLK
jgi:hypothetical protein